MTLQSIADPFSMKQRKIRLLSLSAILVALFLLGGCVTAQPAESTETPLPMEESAVEEPTAEATASESTAATTDSPRILRSSELLGYALYSATGENIGAVNDLVVQLEQGNIPYAVLAIGGFLGIGDELILAPWSHLVIDPSENSIVLSVDPVALEDAPRFQVDDLARVMVDSDWDADIQTFWEREGIDIAPTATPVVAPTDTTTTTNETPETAILVPQGILLSSLLTFNIVDPDGEDLGAIEDLMIDWQQGKMDYMLLSFGGFLGLGDKWFAVPTGVMMMDIADPIFVLDVEPEMLEIAPGLERDNLPNTADENWDQEIRDFWAEWQALKDEINQ